MAEWRHSGLYRVGAVPCGAHLCEVYDEIGALRETLVAFFRAGWEHGERCLWVTSPGVSAPEVREVLRATMPPGERVPEGTIEAVSYADWYGDGRVDLDHVIRQWSDKLDEALSRGYSGFRATSPAPAWDAHDWPRVVEYERRLQAALGDRRSIMLCTYPLARLDADRILDVAHAHDFAITCRGGDVQVLGRPETATDIDESARTGVAVEEAVKARTRTLLRANEALQHTLADHRRVEDALRESESEYRNAIESAHDVIVFEDALGNVLDANRRAEQVTGYSRYELRRMNTLPDLVHPDDRALAEAILRDLQHGQTREYALRWLSKDGRVIYFDASSVGRFSVLGEFISTVCTLRDVTERTAAEAAAREQQTLAEALRDTAAALNSTLDVDALLDQILDSVGRVAPHDAAWIALRAGERWHVARHRGFVERGLGEWVETMPADEQQRLIATAMPGGERALVSNCYVEPNWRVPAEFAWIGSHVSTPIRIKGSLSGILNVESTTAGFFVREHMERLQAFADQAAIALDNARLLTEVRAGRARLQTLSNQLLGAQEAERRTLARELHDEIGQVLTAVAANLRALQLTADPAALQARVDESLDLIDDALVQVRDLSLELRPSMLDDFGLVPALEWFVERLTRRGEIEATLTAPPELGRLQPSLETTLFRVAQIALTNTARHADAHHAWVELRLHEAEIELLVGDDGIGFDVDAAFDRAARGGTLGLLSMDERVRLARGTLTITSRPGAGTLIDARLPLE